MSDDDMNERAAQLRSRLAELDSLEAANEEDRAVVVLDQQSVGRLSRMDALQNQAMAKETQRRRSQERTHSGSTKMSTAGAQNAARRLPLSGWTWTRWR